MGDTKPEAIRALHRRISDEVFRRMRDDEAARGARSRTHTVAEDNPHGGCLT